MSFFQLRPTDCVETVNQRVVERRRISLRNGLWNHNYKYSFIACHWRMTYGGSRNFQNWAKPMNTVISISARRRNLCINPEADLQPAKIVNQSFVHHYRCDLFSFWKFGQPNEPPRLPECGVHTAGLPCIKKKHVNLRCKCISHRFQVQISLP